MATTSVSPIKISAELDGVVSHAAHFLGLTKKETVDRAVRDFVEAHRDEINKGVQEALNQLDGSRAGVVAMLTDLSREQLDELGGFSK